ncbi:MAG: tRNA preQ1(34) S-adenosylmethionine ribosyltransferase-isomerase QueA [Acidimicrobiia bacterium]
MRTSDFSYYLPESAIAQSAVEPRDASRLLDTRDLTDHTFRELPDLLEPGDIVVINRTRVSPMRLEGRREPSGGRIEALLLRSAADGSWEAIMRPTRRLHDGDRLAFGDTVVVLRGDPVDGQGVLVPVVGSLEEAMARAGSLPLPPYFHGELADEERYQTVYGTSPGSAAAHTAGLHFTRDLISALGARQLSVASVDLKVGLDTFRPISVERVADHDIHSEHADVPDETVAAVGAARRDGGRVVAIGTTVVRALESAAAGAALGRFSGSTDLFIQPGYGFRVVDLLVTNFHVPASTLIVLVSAFMGEAWRSAYETALSRGYRFLSFGDAMLAQRSR